MSPLNRVSLNTTQVAEHIERLVLLLKSDEGSETVGGSTVAGDREREDDEDNRIEEV
jgi:hypothetical protein